MQADFRLGQWQHVLADVESVDALIVDAPYSERTHASHSPRTDVLTACERDARWAARGGKRRAIGYACWTAEEVTAFVQAWAPRTRGWFVSLTDHVLAPAWADALGRAGRYVFAPIACMEPGGRVRLAGDGPAQWSVWAVAARPRTRAAQQWGALPGGYVLPPLAGRAEGAEARSVIGGKPLWLMRALVRDYSRQGDLVCDPCAGGATTLLAALQEGRRAVGAEMDPAHYEIGRKRLAGGFTPPLFADDAGRAAEQLELTGGDDA